MNFPARKSLGQHFLHEGRVIERIIAAFHPQEDDVVIEIGPGRGALTRVLAGQVAQLHVIEIDRRLAAALAELPVRVWCRDALTVDYCGFSDQPIRVLGNLPYNISTPLLFLLLQHTGCIADLLLMLQNEVVERMCAAPGSRAYGRLSVMLQQRCGVRKLFRVAPGAFSPPPQVDSAMVAIEPYRRPPYPLRDEARFAAVVKTAFAQRRKTLRNALQPLMSTAQISAAGVDPSQRPEQLSVADYVRLSEMEH